MIARAAQLDPVDLAPAIGARLDRGVLGGRILSGVATDSRDPLSQALFVALEGQRFDGHDFIKAAVEAGAAALLVTEDGFQRAGGRKAVGAAVDVLLVPDTLRALGDTARYHRRRLGVPVLAITGSNGKTSTKEMLAGILAIEGSLLATEGNLNNLIGLPLTLLGLEPSHALCIAEMGMNARGEIARMVEIAEPRVGIVLNIGPAHIGKLGSLENIARAKGEMFEGLDPSSATAVVNLDDARVVERASASPVARWRTFGQNPSADVCLLEVAPRGDAQRLTLSVDGAEQDVFLPLPGHHNAMNAAAAVAAATALEGFRASPASIREGLSSLRGVKGRLTVRSVGKLTVIDDTYNANAASAIAAVEAALALAGGGRLVCAFGEMKELGAYSEEAHRSLGLALANAGFAVVAVFGPEAAPTAEAAGGTVRHEPEDFDRLMSWLLDQLREGDVLLVKGSRGSRMERVLERLEELS